MLASSRYHWPLECLPGDQRRGMAKLPFDLGDDMTKEDIKDKKAAAASDLADLKLDLAELVVLVNRAYRAVVDGIDERLPEICNDMGDWNDSDKLVTTLEKAILSLNAYEEVALKPNQALDFGGCPADAQPLKLWVVTVKAPNGHTFKKYPQARSDHEAAQIVKAGISMLSQIVGVKQAKGGE